MNEDICVKFEERMKECTDSLDFITLAIDVLEAGDAHWAQDIFGIAERRARSLDDKSWVLINGLDHGLCSKKTKARLLDYLEKRVKPDERLVAIDTLIHIGDTKRASRLCMKWAKRARSVEFLAYSAQNAVLHKLADTHTCLAGRNHTHEQLMMHTSWLGMVRSWRERRSCASCRNIRKPMR